MLERKSQTPFKKSGRVGEMKRREYGGLHLLAEN
jgi:hypothetical protein